MADPLLITAGVNVGSSLLGSVFGGKSEAQRAQELLLQFGRDGLPSEIKDKILQDALASINQGVQLQQRGVSSRLAAGGIDPTSGLAQSQLNNVTRLGLEQRGNAIGNINLQEQRMQLDALRTALGGGRQEGLNFFETLSGTSGNLLPFLAARGK